MSSVIELVNVTKQFGSQTLEQAKLNVQCVSIRS